MQISSSDQTNRNDAIQYLLIDLDGTCYDIGNKYEDHVRYTECTNKAQSTRRRINSLHTHICLFLNLMKDMVVRILMVALLGR